MVTGGCTRTQCSSVQSCYNKSCWAIKWGSFNGVRIFFYDYLVQTFFWLNKVHANNYNHHSFIITQVLKKASHWCYIMKLMLRQTYFRMWLIQKEFDLLWTYLPSPNRIYWGLRIEDNNITNTLWEVFYICAIFELKL